MATDSHGDRLTLPTATLPLPLTCTDMAPHLEEGLTEAATVMPHTLHVRTVVVVVVTMVGVVTVHPIPTEAVVVVVTIMGATN